MKRILLSILAIFFPWLVILMEDKFIAAMACLALQLTFVGWIPASIWAFKVINNLNQPKETLYDKKMEEKIQEKEEIKSEQNEMPENKSHKTTGETK